jgi:hypothetical protein
MKPVKEVIDNLFWVPFAVAVPVIAVLLYRLLKHGYRLLKHGYRLLKHGFHAMIYGSAVARTIGEIDLSPTTTLRVFVLENDQIVLEQSYRNRIFYTNTIGFVLLTVPDTDLLIELLQKARS